MSTRIGHLRGIKGMWKREKLVRLGVLGEDLFGKQLVGECILFTLGSGDVGLWLRQVTDV